MLDKIKGYKSVFFFTLVLVVEIANLLGFADFRLTADQQEFIALIVPLLGLALRYFTDSPIFKKTVG